MTKATRFLPFVALATSACAVQQGDFPSLAQREYERHYDAQPEAQAAQETAATIPDELQRRIDEKLAGARTAHGAFMARLPAVRQSVAGAAGDAIASENWAVAQTALSDLESLRSPVLLTLSDLDLMAIEQSLAKNDGEAAIGGEAFEPAIAQAQQWVESEDVEIDRLRASLAG